MFDVGMTRLSMELHSRAFIGGKMLNSDSDEDNGSGTVVYVAQNGVVYHRSRECAYIDLSLHGINAAAVGSLEILREVNIIPVSCAALLGVLQSCI